MHQQAAAVYVPQKVVAQASTLAGTFNDAGDVRHDEADTLVHPHHAQVGEEGGEVVVGDLGLRLGHYAQQRGLAHVGEAHQAYVGQKLELQNDVVALSGEARLGKTGYLPGGGGEVHVAPAAPAAFAEDEGLVIGHILDDLIALRVPHQGTPGDPDDEVRAVLAGLAATLAVHAVGGYVFALVAEVHQGGHAVVHLQNDGTALAAVAAVRAAGRHVFFTVEGHHAVAAVAGFDGDAGLIDE